MSSTQQYLAIPMRLLRLCLLAIIGLLSISAISHALPTLEIGPFGGGFIDGTSPFGTAVEDASGNLVACGSATDTQTMGADCGVANYVVRSGDVATHLISISANNGDPSIPVDDDIVEDVVLEITLHPEPNAVISFESIPSACTAALGGGTNPPSAIVNNADGSITMTCNIGGMSAGQAALLGLPVKASGLSEDGSSYTVTQRAYSSPNTDGSATSTVNTYEDNTPMTISVGPPEWDLLQSQSTTSVWRNDGTNFHDVGQGSELGFFASTWIRVASNRKSGEAITEPLTFSSIFSAASNDASCTGYTPEFHVVACDPNTAGYKGKVYGSGGGDNAVTDSGVCTFERTNPADVTSTQYDFTITGADLSGEHWPTEDARGNDFSDGPYYATNHRMKVFIPLRTVEAADCDDGNYTGSMSLSSVLTEFDPTAPSGASNYGTGTEPGYNGELVDGARGNNELGAGVFEIAGKIGLQKNIYKRIGNAGFSNNRYASAFHAGDGEAEAGAMTASGIYYGNAGNIDLSEIAICDVFDNTTYLLTDSGNVGATAGRYGFLGTYMATTSSTSLAATDFTIEYANIDLTGDDPLDNNADGSYDFNSSTLRYEGDWDMQTAAVCDDSSSSNGLWYTDPTAAPGGIDSINAVRMVQTAASLASERRFTPKQQFRFVVPLEIRSTFNGGPHAGDEIPSGTVMANFATIKSAELDPTWREKTYTPSPETSYRYEGDRTSMSRARLVLDSSSLTPVASSGNTATTGAGSQVVWQVTQSLLSDLSTPVVVDNLQIFSVLPPEASYNGSCTLAQAGGTAPSLIQYNTDVDGNSATGYTRLVWNVGSHTANVDIAPRVFCTDTDPLAPNGTAVVLESFVQADDILTVLARRHDLHTISLLQTGEAKASKTVDSTLDDRNDSQVFSLRWANFSDLVEINSPVVIDRLPYSGDDNVPPSSFSGVYSLGGEPTMTWLDGSIPAAGESPIGVWYYTNDSASGIITNPDLNVSNWCLAANFGSGAAGCPADFTGVTAVKFIANYNLAVNGNSRQGMIAKVTIQAGDPSETDTTAINTPTDIYTNQFTFASSSLPSVLISGSASVQVASYAIGDLVYTDIDGNGQYDSTIDYTAPNGTIINLHKSDGTLMQTTTLGLEQDGRYLFEKVDRGDFYVEIPASEFQLGKPMANWVASTVIADPNVDANEADDQHAYSVGTSLNDGIRSQVITLSAVVVPGSPPVGEEPTADNTANLTTTTLDDFTNFTLDLGLVSPVYDVSGTVWEDANKDGIRQNSEAGLPNVTVVLFGGPYDDIKRCNSVETDANGFYQFEVMPGDYQLIESDLSATPFGSATCPPVASDPSGYTSTTTNTLSLTVYQADVKRQDFGDFAGITVSGTVFDDNGAGGGISGSQTQDGTEAGIGGVTVTASDGSGTVYDTAITATDGSYTLNIPDTVTTVVIREQNKTGYTSTGAEIGSAAGGSYDNATDSISFSLSTATEYTGLNFADIQGPTLAPDNTGTVLPGNVVYYAHTLSTPAAGTVVFTQASDLYTTAGWSNTLYRDSDCNGQLDGSEANTPLGVFNLGVAAGEKICVINKVFAPANVIAQEPHRVTLTATFKDASSSATVALTVADITTASQNESSASGPSGAGILVIRKSVQNMTQGTAATETSNQAAPGDTLKYRITYNNSGNGPITDVVVSDVIPSYAAIVPGSENCDSTPSGMTCVASINGLGISWTVVGPLVGGASGQVSYQVAIDD